MPQHGLRKDKKKIEVEGEVHWNSIKRERGAQEKNILNDYKLTVNRLPTKLIITINFYRL